MEVLAGFVGDSDVFGNGHGDMRAEHAPALSLRDDGGEYEGRERKRLLALGGEVAGAYLVFVARLRRSAHLDAAKKQSLLEGCRRKRGWIFNGHRHVKSGCGRGAPGADQHGAGQALETRVGRFTRPRGRHGVLNCVVVHVGRPLGLGCGGRRGVGREEDLVGVVIER